VGLLAELRARVSTQALTATDGRDVLVNGPPDGWAVEKPQLWWTSGDGIQGPFGNPIPGSLPWANLAGIPAVARCTSIIVDELAAVPWKLYRDRVELALPDWIADPQALRLDGRVVDPSGLLPARLSHVDFWSSWLTDALWWGDGLIYSPTRDATGAPKPPLWLVDPLQVDLRADGYWVRDVRLDPGAIIHLRGPGPIVAGRGSGAFSRFAAELGYTLTVKDYANSVFYSGVPSGYLKVNKDGLTQPAADALRTSWDAKHAQGRRETAVLNSTTDYHALSWSPTDATLVDVVNANLNELANAFGVPGYMIGATGDTATYANLEGRRRDLVTFTYLPWSSRIEAVLDAQFPRGVGMKVALDGLQRGDASTRGPFLTSMVAAGIYPKAYAQALEDVPPQYIEAEQAPPEVTT
jgi:HK97 family phage portal protein